MDCSNLAVSGFSFNILAALSTNITVRIDTPPTADLLTVQLFCQPKLCASVEAWSCVTATNYLLAQSNLVSESARVRSISGAKDRPAMAATPQSLTLFYPAVELELKCAAASDTAPTVQDSRGVATRIVWNHTAGCPLQPPQPHIAAYISLAIVAYLVAGICYNSCVLGQTTFPEILPNAAFWTSVFQKIGSFFSWLRDRLCGASSGGGSGGGYVAI